MPVPLYMDKHVKRAVTDQLRLRGVDVLTAAEDGNDRLPDDRLLLRATQLARLTFTQDIRFKAMAEQWQRDGWAFAGLVFAHQLRATVGQLVEDLELIAKASEPAEWIGQVEHLPFRRRGPHP